MIKVLVADDFPIIREGIRQILEDTKDIRVSSEAADGQEVLDKVNRNNVDVVLLDVSMPGKGGLETLKEIKSLNPKVPVLMLSMHPEEQYAVRAMKAGAAGYITKARTHDELVQAIRRVAGGRKYISESLAEALPQMIGTQMEQPLYKALSDREFEVLRKIASGFTVSEIARQLGLNVKTVSTYRSRLLKKMNIRNNAQLTRYAIQNDLVE